jgi:hypothetical protein
MTGTVDIIRPSLQSRREKQRLSQAGRDEAIRVGMEMMDYRSGQRVRNDSLTDSSALDGIHSFTSLGLDDHGVTATVTTRTQDRQRSLSATAEHQTLSGTSPVDEMFAHDRERLMGASKS